MIPNKFIVTPEVLLPRLNKRLLELRSAICWLDTDGEKLNDALVDLLRKLLITQILHEKYIIAITGMQGAGKTTFLQQLYGLDNIWIEPNQGRGEHMPVLILEDAKLTSPKGYLVSMLPQHTVSEFGIVEHEVEPNVFKAALKGGTGNQLFPILKVPQCYFTGENQGFVLLPGYEKENKGNKSWQSLMRQTLIASAMCVVVTDETRMAAEQRDIMVDLNNNLAGAKPVIVISNTEYSSAEKRESLKQTASTIFGIHQEEVSTRVICSGADEQYRNEWLPEFKLSIEKYAQITDTVRGRQIEHLEIALRNELSDLLEDVKDAMTKKSIATGSGENEVQKIIELFDSACSRVEKIYKSELESSLNSHANDAIKRIQKHLGEHERGWENIWERLKNGMSLHPERNQSKYENGIEQAWRDVDGNGFSTTFKDVLGNVTSKELGILGALNPAITAVTDKPLLLLGYHNQINSGTLTQENGQSEMVQKNLNSLFYPSSDDDHKLDPVNKEFMKSVALIPVLGLEFTRLAALFPSAVGVDMQTFVPVNGDMKDAVGRFEKDFTFLKGTHSNIIKGIAAILAVDMAADGKIDTIPALFSAVTGGTASTAASVVSGVVAIGIISVCVINEFNRASQEKEDVAKRVISAIRNTFQAHYMQHFDQLMDQLRRTLEQRLQVRYRLNEDFMHRDRLNKAIADVKSLRQDLLGELGGLTPTLG